ncbi:hypothetical protein GOC23_30685 [Sinorhizobium meliloti]|nr:hypothetical protein [Sinorhizobium meliloti]
MVAQVLPPPSLPAKSEFFLVIATGHLVCSSCSQPLLSPTGATHCQFNVAPHRRNVGIVFSYL